METFNLTEEDMQSLSRISERLGALVELFGNFMMLYARAHKLPEETEAEVSEMVVKIFTKVMDKGAIENAE